MVSRLITIRNEEGIHLRPAASLCEATYRFQSKISICFEGREINAKSLLSVLSAGIGPGDVIEVICDGSDEVQALNAIERVIMEL